MSWIKMNPDYRPKVGEELLATFSDYPEGIGTLYLCTQITPTSFFVKQIRSIAVTQITEIPESASKTFEISFDLIPLINLRRKFSFTRV
jgi:hypothetical protein